jgi:hypothetical protein
MYDQPVTAADLEDALDRHARMTRPKESASYEQKLREVGFVVAAVALTWLAFGAPGVPAVGEFVAINVAPYVDELWRVAAVVVGLAIAAAIVEAAYGSSLPPFVSFWLQVPVWALSLLVRVSLLLGGVAVVGAVTVVSAPWPSTCSASEGESR